MRLTWGQQDLMWTPRREALGFGPGRAPTRSPDDTTHQRLCRRFLQDCPLVWRICHLFECHHVPDAGSTNVVTAAEGCSVRPGFQKVLTGGPAPRAFRAPYEHTLAGAASRGWCLGPTLQASDSPIGVLYSKLVSLRAKARLHSGCSLSGRKSGLPCIPHSRTFQHKVPGPWGSFVTTRDPLDVFLHQGFKVSLLGRPGGSVG